MTTPQHVYYERDNYLLKNRGRFFNLMIKNTTLVAVYRRLLEFQR
uniref:Glycosyl transferase n=1 Tax=Heterorhabditis bacteriophora TaxID=37862 RepID=A0A1I7XG86_HETBA